MNWHLIKNRKIIRSLQIILQQLQQPQTVKVFATFAVDLELFVKVGKCDFRFPTDIEVSFQMMEFSYTMFSLFMNLY
jgi:hypothetical protein